jgi:hypothetical protein
MFTVSRNTLTEIGGWEEGIILEFKEVVQRVCLLFLS